MLEHRRSILEERHVTNASTSVIDWKNDRFLVELSWHDPQRGPEPERLWQLLTLRDGAIVKVQDYSNPTKARQALR